MIFKACIILNTSNLIHHNNKMISFLFAAKLVSNTKAIEDTTANKNTILFYS